MKKDLSPNRIRESRFVFLPNPAIDREWKSPPAGNDQTAKSGVLGISRDGTVTVIPIDLSRCRDVSLVGGRILKTSYSNSQNNEIAVVDILTGGRVRTFPYQRRNNKIIVDDYWMLTLPSGYLVHQPHKLSFYNLSEKTKAAWEQPYVKHTRKPYPYGASRDGKFIYTRWTR